MALGAVTVAAGIMGMGWGRELRKLVRGSSGSPPDGCYYCCPATSGISTLAFCDPNSGYLCRHPQKTRFLGGF